MALKDKGQGRRTGRTRAWPQSGSTESNQISQNKQWKDIYFPKMTLDYVLYDQTKTEVGRASGVKIKDMGFMQSGNIGLKNREFAYEQQMLEKWFDKVLVPQLNSAKPQ